MWYLNTALSSLREGAAMLNYSIANFVTSEKDNTLLGIDMSIEGLRSQTYSYYIFGFLIVSLIIFSGIIYIYMPRGRGRLKIGEKIMFGAIMMGVVLAIFIGWLQLVEGYLI